MQAGEGDGKKCPQLIVEVSWPVRVSSETNEAGELSS